MITSKTGELAKVGVEDIRAIASSCGTED